MGGLAGNYWRWGKVIVMVVVMSMAEGRGYKIIHLIGKGQKKGPEEEIDLVWLGNTMYKVDTTCLVAWFS